MRRRTQIGLAVCLAALVGMTAWAGEWQKGQIPAGGCNNCGPSVGHSHCGRCGGIRGRRHSGHCPLCKHRQTFEGQDPWASCGCNGSYKYPVPPLYTYHWRGMFAHDLMTNYHSPWRFPAIKPFNDPGTQSTMRVNEAPNLQPVNIPAPQMAPPRTAKRAPATRASYRPTGKRSRFRR